MGEWAMCDECMGTGIIITCCDDLCANSDHCIHGDGEAPCPECEGSGQIYTPDQEEVEE
jgi:hypothetical protein